MNFCIVAVRRNLSIEIDANGRFIWNDQHFKSLSHVARSITGYNVSGFKFFGVKS